MSYYDSKKLMQTLQEIEVASPESLQELYELSQDQKRSYVELVIEHDLVSEKNMGRLLSDLTEFKYIDLSQQSISQKVLQIIPEIVARQKQVVAFKRDKQGLHVAMVNPADLQTKEFLEKKSGQNIIAYITFKPSLQDAWSLYSKEIKTAFDDLIEENVERALNNEGSDSLIINIINNLIEYAYRNKASDIHIEPLEEETKVRFRIDGVLHDVVDLPVQLHQRLVTRVKVMASLRIDEHQATQDGKIEYDMENEQLDLRVSIVPLTKGEKIVMRLLSERARQHSLEDLGLDDDSLEKVRAAYKKPYGMILSTGPTGSGKTTTLYSILKLLNKRSVNIMTIEDPVEYDLERVNQIQVNKETELTFAKGLRSIVRQDPDIILVGEIRDEETAGIAINSAMTGHLVLSTLHTNDAATSVPRLIDLGVEPYLIASTVSVVVAQRLVRQICSNCRVSYNMDLNQDQTKSEDKQVELNRWQQLLKLLPQEYQDKYFLGGKAQIYYGKGCEVCHNSGYQGRIGIYEVLEIDDQIRDAISNQKDASDIKKIAVQNGMTTMIEDGLQKIKQGVTTIEEVLRVAKE